MKMSRHRLAGFGVAVGVAAWAIIATTRQDLGARGESCLVAFLGLLALAVAIEPVVVPVELGPVAILVGLGELALVPAIAYLPLAWVAVIRLVGPAVDDRRRARPAPIKTTNRLLRLGEVLVAGAIVAVVRRMSGPARGPLVPAWQAAVAVTGSALVVGIAGVTIARAITKRKADKRTVRLTIGVSAAQSAMLSALAVIGIVLFQQAPILLPVLAVFLAWGIWNARRWVSVEQRLKRTRRLYDFARLLETSPDSKEAVRDILDEVRRILAARSVELVLPSQLGDDEHIAFMPDGEPSVAVLDVRARALLAGEIGAIHVRAADGPDAELDRLGASEVLITPLGTSRDDVRGLLSLVDREGRVANFTPEDVTMAQALASHLALWLERSKLSERLTQELRIREHQALHDDITGLPNRRGLAEYARDIVTGVAADGTASALALVDLNRFKEINDTLGHAAGDRLLGHVASRLRHSLPTSWVVCRLGGDEFVVAADNLVSPEAIGQTIRTVLRDHYHVDDIEVLVDAAIGIAVIGEHGTDVETLLRHADVAMYESKRMHTPFAVYRPPAQELSPDWLSLTAQLDRGIRNDELVVHYQPKVDLASGLAIGCEALVRWRHPNGQLVSPDEFVPLAEDAGLAGPLFDNVLDQSLAQLRAWHDEGMVIGVAVNMSARNLVGLDLVDTVSAAVARHDVPAGCVTLELTETAAVTNHEVAMETLSALRSLGIRTSLDDFGTGNSPLRLLHDLPVDELKIDRSFVGAMTADPNGRHIVANLVQLARDLNKTIVAEGVENATISGMLVGMMCDYAQGWHYARAMESGQCTRWLRNNLTTALQRQQVTTAVATSGRSEQADRFGLYVVLNVPCDASRLDITRAYAAAHHDAVAGDDGGRVDALRLAYEVLSNPLTRARHDREHGDSAAAVVLAPASHAMHSSLDSGFGRSA